MTVFDALPPLGLIVAVVLLLVLQRRLPPFRPPYYPTPRDKVDVHLDTSGDTFKLRVDPWWVPVARNKPLRWILHSAPGATMEIKAKDQNRWPFPGPPLPAPAGPNVPIQAGNVRGTLNETYSYSIELEVNGRTYDIDPDIFICE